MKLGGAFNTGQPAPAAPQAAPAATQTAPEAALEASKLEASGSASAAVHGAHRPPDTHPITPAAQPSQSSSCAVSSTTQLDKILTSGRVGGMLQTSSLDLPANASTAGRAVTPVQPRSEASCAVDANAGQAGSNNTPLVPEHCNPGIGEPDPNSAAMNPLCHSLPFLQSLLHQHL